MADGKGDVADGVVLWWMEQCGEKRRRSSKSEEIF